MNDAIFSQIDFGPLKEFLEEEYINKNRTLEDITKECEVSEDLIYDYRYIIKHLILCKKKLLK